MSRQIILIGLMFGLFAISLGLVVVKPVMANGPTIDHRFYLELPDGKQVEIKGPKIHRASKDGADKPTVITNHCRYQEYIAAGKEINVQRDVAGGYHCSTNESCFTQDYGAPYLPSSFNQASEVYTDSDASFFAFYKKTFTDMLKTSTSYNPTNYSANNIRGFEGAKWVGKVDWEVDTGGSIQILQSPPSKPLDADGWGTIPGYSSKQSWGSGEVYLNTEGGNVLQGKITWVLKLPQQKSLACKSISPAGKPAWDPAKVKKGAELVFNCATVEGAESYEFRVIEPDSKTVSVPYAGPGTLPTERLSGKYTVSKVGSHIAQCRVCASTGKDCTAWENVSEARQRDE